MLLTKLRSMLVVVERKLAKNDNGASLSYSESRGLREQKCELEGCLKLLETREQLDALGLLRTY